MSQSTTSENSKPAKRYSKTRGEHVKDILIAVLITAVIAFIGGTVFANKQTARVEQAVKSAQALATPTAHAEGK
jgi:hypothetical protein